MRLPDYSAFDDARLVELWAERETLTDEARPLLEAQMDARGLTKKKPQQKAAHKASTLLREDGTRALAIDEEPMDLKRARFAEVAPLLKLQLFSATGRTAYVTAMNRDAVVVHEIASGLFMVLVYDFGASELTVSRGDAKRWGMDDATLFALALANLAKAPVHVQVLEHRIGLAFGNGSFVSSLALKVDELAEAAGIRSTDGYVVGVPNWHALVFAPLPIAPETMASLAEVNAKLFDYVDAVSGELYRVETGAATSGLPRWPVVRPSVSSDLGNPRGA